jgi:cytochrome c oxidase assembly factor 6
MGWFSNSPSTPKPPPPESSKDGGFIAPDRSSRQKCWDGRDAFFKCLDDNGIIDSVKEGEKAKSVCPAELKAFEGVCAESWVTYFKKRRVFEHQKEQTIRKLEAEGAQPLDGGQTLGALKGR